MKVLYIGQYSSGTTSKMRADILRELLIPSKFEVIDTHVPFYKTSKIWRSIGFRYKIGRLISETNNYVLEELKKLNLFNFDVIWIDKGIFFKPSTLKFLKKQTIKLVHFTPDMAFYQNKSKLFEKSMPFYDFLVTTKTSELKFYRKKVDNEKIILTTQGFSKTIHKSFHKFEDKNDAVVFIGLAEPHRLSIAERILDSKINLKLVGKGWGKFVEKYKGNKNLTYLGETIYDDEYSKLISSSMFGLGLLSKRFPELHTTRTFEIPACRTALLTERNQETQSFFQETEAIFYDDTDELIKKVKYYQEDTNELELITRRGYDRVNLEGYDYYSLLKNIIVKINKEN